jgi:hypothetical protein
VWYWSELYWFEVLWVVFFSLSFPFLLVARIDRLKFKPECVSNRGAAKSGDEARAREPVSTERGEVGNGGVREGGLNAERAPPDRRPRLPQQMGDPLPSRTL